MDKSIADQFKEEVYNALEKCQFVEETLRMCISHAIEIAKLQLSPYFPLEVTGNDLGKMPLGTLVNVFSRINNDTALIKSLRSITTDRNHVAHNSLLFTLGELGDATHMQQELKKMKAISERANQVHGRVLDIRYELLRSLGVVERQHHKTTS